MLVKKHMSTKNKTGLCVKSHTDAYIHVYLMRFLFFLINALLTQLLKFAAQHLSVLISTVSMRSQEWNLVRSAFIKKKRNIIRYTCMFQYIDIALYCFINKHDVTSISKLCISIQRDTGSKVNYFTCIFRGLFLRSFGSGKSLIALGMLVMYKKC